MLTIVFIYCYALCHLPKRHGALRFMVTHEACQNYCWIFPGDYKDILKVIFCFILYQSQKIC